MISNFITRVLSLFADKRRNNKESTATVSNSQPTKEAQLYNFFDLEKLIIRKEINGMTFWADEVIELPVVAECIKNIDPWGGKKYPKLEVGKLYTIKVIRVDRSFTEIILDGIRASYNSTMFNITCDGEPYDFMAKAMPYYRRNRQYGIIGATLAFWMLIRYAPLAIFSLCHRTTIIIYNVVILWNQNPSPIIATL